MAAREPKITGAGRRPNAEAKDLQSLISKAEWEMLKYDATCCNDLKALYDLQRDLAFGTGELGKNASVTNRKTAISEMISRGESYALGEAPMLHMEKDEDLEDAISDNAKEEARQVANGSPVMSFEQKREQFMKLQAEKKAKEG